MLMLRESTRMIYCQNCGYNSHCGNPVRKSMYSSPRSADDALQEIEICKKCRCQMCSDSSFMFGTHKENNKTSFTFHDQNSWDWE